MGFYCLGEKKWVENFCGKFDSDLKNFKKLLGEFLVSLKFWFGDIGFGVVIQAGGGLFGNNYVFENWGVSDGKLYIIVFNSDGGCWSFFSDGKVVGVMGILSGFNSGNWFGDIFVFGFISFGKYIQGSGKFGGNFYKGVFGEILVYDHFFVEGECVVL